MVGTNGSHLSVEEGWFHNARPLADSVVQGLNGGYALIPITQRLRRQAR